MTKATLTALGAALISLGQELQGEDTPATETPAKATRRGKAPAEEKTETPPGGTKTEAELRALIQPLVESGRAAEVKKELAKFDATKLADLVPANHAEFVKNVEGLLI